MQPVQVAVFPKLTIQVAGGGTVAVDPPEGPYAPGSLATVTATPSPGWTFLQWLGDATGTNPAATLSMSQDRCVQAVFGTSIMTNVIGGGSIHVYPQAPLYPHGQRAWGQRPG